MNEYNDKPVINFTIVASVTFGNVECHRIKKSGSSFEPLFASILDLKLVRFGEPLSRL